MRKKQLPHLFQQFDFQLNLAIFHLILNLNISANHQSFNAIILVRINFFFDENNLHRKNNFIQIITTIRFAEINNCSIYGVKKQN